MCGIFGHYHPNGPDTALVERMARVLAHRGPDGYDTVTAGPLAFGAGRLAIIDLAAPAGPILNEDGRVAVVFNGEIYNYRALRAELEALGHRFATHTDTEVIVHGYEAWGQAVLDRLRGMFGLGIWDAGSETLLLARDRLGEKPLYYTAFESEFLFASEIKALLEHPRLRREVDAEALLNYLAVGYVPAPLTMFQHIRKLFPGERLVLDRSGLRTGRYWQPVMDTRQPMDYRQTVGQVRHLLTEAVEMRLMSDVPIGAFLSGGVDSTAVVALMSRALGRPVQTFTVGFDMAAGSRADAKFNVDAHYAARAAQVLKTDHHAITIRQDESLGEQLVHFIHALDEPVAEQAIIQTAYVSALARLNGVPVLLTGDGGDELFAGYDHFRADQRLSHYLRLPGLLRQTVITPLLERLPSDNLRKLAEKSRDTDWVRRYLTWKRMTDLHRFPELLADPVQASRAYDAINGALRPFLDAPRTRHFADRLAFAGLRSWLAEDSNMRVDKMSMLMSTETRAPLEDHHLAELALRIPLAHKLRRGDFKVVLKDAVADLIPAEILHRPKWGFIPPISEWLRSVLRPLVDTYLAPDYVAAAGFFQPETVARLVDEHLTKRAYHMTTLWTLLTFHLWHAVYIEGSLKPERPLVPADLMVSAVLPKGAAGTVR
ncbi:MAG: asparagine synthase (glutamine-hydrolyzing) [Chloroflexi bacterium]|nr:asparagine synthase (glutamine-hydrolyzing) [Chloroflexota bacterium]